MKRSDKDQLVAELKGKLEGAAAVYYTDFTGLNVKSMTNLRRRFRKAGVEYVVIKNTRVFGGEWVLDPTARPDDGMFELVPIRGRIDLTSKLVASLRHLPVDGDLLRELGLEHSEPIRGRPFVLTVAAPGSAGLPHAQIDGEELTAGDRYRIEVLPRCLNVIIPERSP